MAKKRNITELQQSSQLYTKIQEEIDQLNHDESIKFELDNMESNELSFFNDCIKKFSVADVNVIIEIFTNKFIGLNRTVICRTTGMNIDEFINNSSDLTKDVFKALTSYLDLIKSAHKILSKENLSSHCHGFINLLVNEGCRQNHMILFKDKNNTITYNKTTKTVKG